MKFKKLNSKNKNTKYNDFLFGLILSGSAVGALALILLIYFWSLL